MKIENRQQLLIVLTVAVGVLYAADQMVFEPLIGWWKSRAKTVAALRTQVHDGRLLIQREAGLRSRWDRCARTPCRPTPRWRSNRCSRPLTTGRGRAAPDVNGIMPAMEQRFGRIT